MKQKRFQFWGSTNGVPQIKWTKWFNHRGIEEPIQMKCSRNIVLKNEYRTI